LPKPSIYRGKYRCCRARIQVKLAPCNAFKRSNTNFGPTARNGSIWAFKRKGRSESFRYPDAKQFQIDPVNSRIKLPPLSAGAQPQNKIQPELAKSQKESATTRA
jgi:hypothetical protein